MRYTPGRTYARTNKKGVATGPYRRSRVVDVTNLKKWARVQARELSLRMRDMH